MWFNFQAHHLHEYAAMETQDRATQANQYRINRFIIGKQTIVKLLTIVSIASATIVIAKNTVTQHYNLHVKHVHVLRRGERGEGGRAVFMTVNSFT